MNLCYIHISPLNRRLTTTHTSTHLIVLAGDDCLSSRCGHHYLCLRCLLSTDYTDIQMKPRNLWIGMRNQFKFGLEIVPVYVPVAVLAHRSIRVSIVPLPVALANAPLPPVTV